MSWPIISKLIGQLVMPAGLLWLALIAALFVYRKDKKQRWIWGGLLLAFTLCGNLWFGNWLIRVVEGRVDSVHPQDVPQLDALFVLGGGTKLGPRDYPEAGDMGDRIVLAARLYKAGKVPILITSGRSIPGVGEYQDLTTRTATIWTEFGVPRSAIIRLNTAHNTSGELEDYKQLMAERGFKKAGILSSAVHLPRVMANARKQGLDLIPVAADHRGGHVPPNLIFLVPSGQGFRAVGIAFHEIVGGVAGR